MYYIDFTKERFYKQIPVVLYSMVIAAYGIPGTSFRELPLSNSSENRTGRQVKNIPLKNRFLPTFSGVVMFYARESSNSTIYLYPLSH
jgi:hypothetical protein